VSKIPVVVDSDHEYLSTACHHEIHDRCRFNCKYCDHPCQCECHVLLNPLPVRKASPPAGSRAWTNKFLP
jgi:hypothetical protein